MPSRQEVYAVIDGERAYQDDIIANNPTRHDATDHQHPVGSFLTMMDTYLRRAQDAWTDKAGHDPALEVIRKIAAIAVQCMERHGAPPREVPLKKPLGG